VEKNVPTIFRKLGLTEQSLIDRRVTAGLIHTRAQTSPFARHQPLEIDES